MGLRRRSLMHLELLLLLVVMRLHLLHLLLTGLWLGRLLMFCLLLLH